MKDLLSSVPGVQNVEIDMKTKLVVVTVEKGKVKPDALLEKFKGHDRFTATIKD